MAGLKWLDDEHTINPSICCTSEAPCGFHRRFPLAVRSPSRHEDGERIKRNGHWMREVPGNDWVVDDDAAR